MPPSYGRYETGCSNFCDGAANEGVAGADTRITAASGLRTHEPRFAGGETDEARSGAAEADPAWST